MSDEKKYTEREMVLAKRTAFVMGAAALHIQAEIPDTARASNAVDRVTDSAFVASRYPLPKKRVGRVVRSTETGFRYELWNHEGGGITIVTDSGIKLHDAGSHVRCLPLVDVPLIADLLANPTEEVEDVG